MQRTVLVLVHCILVAGPGMSGQWRTPIILRKESANAVLVSEERIGVVMIIIVKFLIVPGLPELSICSREHDSF